MEMVQDRMEYKYNNHEGSYEIGSDMMGYVGRIGTEKDAKRICVSWNCHDRLLEYAKELYGYAAAGHVGWRTDAMADLWKLIGEAEGGGNG